MPILTPAEAYGVLLLAGMPKGQRCTEFVAIGICESSLDTEAVSPAGALGVWQVMPFNFAPLGLSVADWRNPDINARAAVLLSGHGANCAAWDTCYRDITASGRYRYLNWPESGSCAANHLTGVAAAVGTASTGGASRPLPPGTQDQLHSVLAQFQGLATRVLPTMQRDVDTITARVNGMTRGPGW